MASALRLVTWNYRKQDAGMGQRRHARQNPWMLFLFLFAMAALTGCSRQVAVPSPAKSDVSGQLPFARSSDGDGVSPTATLPFEGLPAGTEITIRLGESLSSETCRVGESFVATLDSPLVIAGKAVVPRGIPVTGKVLDTKPSAGHEPGYLRLTVVALVVNEKSLILQTSSIFIKGGLSDKRSPAITDASKAGRQASVPATVVESGGRSGFTLGDVRFSTGHQLTFRLIQPVQL